MPKRQKKKTSSPSPSYPKRTGAKTPHYRYLEHQPKGFYSRQHYCAFCGAEGYAHVKTRLAALLFCDAKCFRLYRYHLIVHPAA